MESDLVSIFGQIRALARRDARLEEGQRYSRLFFMNWWCSYYKRPIKDPMLETYTTEELAYEYYWILEKAASEEERVNKATDKIEEEKQRAAEEWADKMEALEEEEERAEAERLKKEQEQSISNDEEWMKAEIEKNKEIFGEDFGEDLSLDFNGE